MANILIIGDGAIGLLLSHFLSKAHTVHVLTRKATANTRFYCKAKQPSQKITKTEKVPSNIPSHIQGESTP